MINVLLKNMVMISLSITAPMAILSFGDRHLIDGSEDIAFVMFVVFSWIIVGRLNMDLNERYDLEISLKHYNSSYFKKYSIAYYISDFVYILSALLLFVSLFVYTIPEPNKMQDEINSLPLMELIIISLVVNVFSMRLGRLLDLMRDRPSAIKKWRWST